MIEFPSFSHHCPVLFPPRCKATAGVMTTPTELMAQSGRHLNIRPGLTVWRHSSFPKREKHRNSFHNNYSCNASFGWGGSITLRCACDKWFFQPDDNTATCGRMHASPPRPHGFDIVSRKGIHPQPRSHRDTCVAQSRRKEPFCWVSYRSSFLSVMGLN